MLRVKTDVYKSSTITTANGKTMKQKDIISAYENNKTKIIKRARSVNPEATIFKVTEQKINKTSKEDGLRKKLKQLLIHQFENQFKKSDISKEKRKTSTAKKPVKKSTPKKPVKKSTPKKPVKKSTTKKPVKKTTKRKKTKMESK
jgi:hypothetical protein